MNQETASYMWHGHRMGYGFFIASIRYLSFFIYFLLDLVLFSVWFLLLWAMCWSFFMVLLWNNRVSFAWSCWHHLWV